MADYNEPLIRAQGEIRLNAVMEQIHKQQAKQLKREVKLRGSVGKIQPEVWQDAQEETERSLFEPLAWIVGSTFAAVLAGLYFRDELADSLELFRNRWAGDKAREVAEQHTTTTKKYLRKRELERVRVSTRKAKRKPKANEPKIKLPTKKEVQELNRQEIDKALGKKRAERVAITETTNAISGGVIEASREFDARTPTQKTELIWRVERDPTGRINTHVCPICRPLEGKKDAYWSAFFPNGPAAHPHCRCWLQVFVTIA